MNDSPAPCHVYTPDWTARWVNRHKRLPEHALPPWYHFWTEPEYQESRGVIERWVDALSPEKRAKVIARLRSVDQFEQTRAEMAVGASLRRAGHGAAYEVPLWGDQTPDWHVRPTDGAVPFAVEVVSSMLSAQRRQLDRACDRLRQRVEQLRGTAFVSLQARFGSERQSPPSDRELAEVAKGVKHFLKPDPPVGAATTVRQFGVEVVDHFPDSATVSCLVGLQAHQIDTEPLSELVREKARKYRELAEQLRLAFAVCIVPDRSMGLNLEDLRDAVFGSRGCRPVLKPGGGFGAVYYRKQDGLFMRYPTLSAAMLGTWTEGGLVCNVVLNPRASYPLTEQVFPSPMFEIAGSEPFG